MDTLPEDILLIHYPNLGISAGERLNLLGIISVLLDKHASFYTPAMLGLDPDKWDALHKWVSEGYGAQFWRVELHGIKISNVCEKHILIGTGQLLEDLRSTPVRISSPRQFLEN